MEHHSGENSGDELNPPTAYPVRQIDLHPAIPPLEVTVVVNVDPGKVDNSGYRKTIDAWVKKIKELYYNDLSENERVVIAVVPDPGIHYENGEDWNKYGPWVWDEVQPTPFRLFQFCVGGRHVLFVYVNNHYGIWFPHPLYRLLSDDKTVLACVHKEKLAQELQNHSPTRKPIRMANLREIAPTKWSLFLGHDNPNDSYTDLMDLADSAFYLYDVPELPYDINEVWSNLSGGVERGYLLWWKDPKADRLELSEEKILTGAFLVYLVYLVAQKLKVKSSTRGFIHSTWQKMYEEAKKKKEEMKKKKRDAAGSSSSLA